LEPKGEEEEEKEGGRREGRERARSPKKTGRALLL
jgi:hypothetical protein